MELIKLGASHVSLKDSNAPPHILGLVGSWGRLDWVGRSAPLRIITLKCALRGATHLAVLAEPLANPQVSKWPSVFLERCRPVVFPRISQVPQLC
jgi:hypothetical protein